MRKYTSEFLSLLMLAAALQITSCTDIDPNNPGVDEREKFLGTWSVTESCVRLIYEVNITEDENNNSRVWLNNFADAPPDFTQAYGIVSGDQINLPEQTIGDGWKINGIGTLQTTGIIVWAYYIEIGAVGSNCEAECKK